MRKVLQAMVFLFCLFGPSALLVYATTYTIPQMQAWVAEAQATAASAQECARTSHEQTRKFKQHVDSLLNANEEYVRDIKAIKQANAIYQAQRDRLQSELNVEKIRRAEAEDALARIQGKP